MESRGELVISSIDKIYREGNYIVVDVKDNQGHFTCAEFTLEDFSKLMQQSLDQEKQIKDNLVQQIMAAMNQAREMAYGDISFDERMYRRNDIKNRLGSKTVEDLQTLLSTYQELAVNLEEQHTSLMRR